MANVKLYTRVTDRGVITQLAEGTAAAFHVEVPVLGLAQNSVTWAPYKEESAGHYVEWADAVAALQTMQAPTVLYIDADVECDEVMIPGGEWNLNDTLIVGPTPRGADYDDSNWPSGTALPLQDRLYVYTQDDYCNPCRINGCRGLKDVLFYGETEPHTHINEYTEIPGYGDFSCIYVCNTSLFREGQRVMIGDHECSSDFVGYFIVVAVNEEEGSIVVYNDDYDSWDGGTLDPGSGYWRVWPDTSVFYFEGSCQSNQKEFILDGVELRKSDWDFDNKWGTIHYDFDVDATLRVVNNSSTHPFCVSVDADQINVVTRDACKIGWKSFDSYDDNGYVKFHIGAGTRQSTCQGLNWDGFYPYIQS